MLFDLDSAKTDIVGNNNSSVGDLSSMFDKIDFVFIDGDTLSFMPWAREND